MFLSRRRLAPGMVEEALAFYRGKEGYATLDDVRDYVAEKYFGTSDPVIIERLFPIPRVKNVVEALRSKRAILLIPGLNGPCYSMVI